MSDAPRKDELMAWLRRLAAERLDRRLVQRLPGIEEDALRQPSVIVAPHPDDETLGCGGLACRMIAAGTPVHFVIVTDGAASHPMIPGTELRVVREAEAIEAVVRLGGAPESVRFLGIPDGKAMHHIEAITTGLSDLFAALQPTQVFIPHPDDPMADHVAVHRGALEALRLRGATVTVFEYPVWYWFHWPWVPMGGHKMGLWKKALRQTLRASFGTGALRSLNARIDIAPELPQKRAALAAHVSQTQRPDGAHDSPVLADLGSGGFLARLMSETEMFRRYTLPGGRPSA
jgi:LmbE family N-acetylglucosaminyl deacetylase